MTTRIGGIVVDIDARLAKLEASLAKADRKFDAFEKNFKRQGASIERAVGGINASFARLGTAAAGLFAGFSVAAAARGLSEIADEAKSVEAQLKLATDRSGNFAKAQEDVRRIAEASRTGLADTAALYAVFQRNAQELGITQAEAARMTETVSKSFIISGASAAEAAGGLRQFLQGIQSGTLRGEELNSVLENAPRLARALADGLGVTIGQLRQMGADGELTGERIKNAILQASAAIDGEFKQMPVTFDQAMTQINNAAVVTFGAFDRGGQFSTALSNFVLDGSQGFKSLENDAERFGIEVRAHIEGLATAFEPFVDAGAFAFRVLGIEAEDFTREIDALGARLSDLLDLPTEIQNAGIRARNSFNDFFGIQSQFGGPEKELPSAARARERDRSRNASTLDRIMGNTAELFRPAPPPPPTRRAPSGGGGGGARRRSGGGGARRKVEPVETAAQIRERLSFELPEWGGYFFDEPIADVQALIDETNSLGTALADLPNLGRILTIEEEQRLDRFVSDFAASFEGAFENALFNGDLKGAFAGLFEDLGRLTVRLTIIEPLAREAAAAIQSIGGAGGLFGTIGSFLGIGGGVKKRALGGYTPPGWTMVGERGPELMKIGQPSSIVPNHRLMQAGPAVDGGSARVVIELDGDMLNARIVEGSAAVVQASRPSIVAGAVNETIRRFKKPGLNG